MKQLINVSPLLASMCVLLASLLFSACASGPELEKFPRREIDRPYTLPKGVATWHIPTVYENIRTQNSSLTFGPSPVPLLWESSLSDDWNLIWFPIPLGVSHQFFQSESDRLGMNILTGLYVGSVSGLRIQPNLNLSYRRFLSKETAIELLSTYAPSIAFKSGQDYRWTASVSAGPLFQVSDTLSLKPSVSFDLSHGPYSSLNTLDDNSNTLASDSNTSLGFGASAVWSFARKWDLRPDYHYSGIGSKNQQTTHLAVLDFVLFW